MRIGKYLGLDFKKLIELMKDDLGEKIMIKFVRLSPKSNSYLIDVCSEGKKKTQKSVS